MDYNKGRTVTLEDKGIKVCCRKGGVKVYREKSKSDFSDTKISSTKYHVYYYYA